MWNKNPFMEYEQYGFYIYFVGEMWTHFEKNFLVISTLASEEFENGSEGHSAVESKESV